MRFFFDLGALFSAREGICFWRARKARQGSFKLGTSNPRVAETSGQMVFYPV